MWAIQYVESADSPADAQAMLAWVRQQDGYIGGRVLAKSHDGRPDRMQAFFQDETGIDPALLPDGCRRVFIPDGQRTALGIR